MTSAALPTVGVVLLHMGDRPVELATALQTLQAQRGVELDVVLVGNGWEPTGVPDWVRTVHLPTNVGVPEGRNVGAAEVRGEFLQFYDDDAALPAPDTLARMVRVMQDDPRVAVVQPRGVDPDGQPSPRRWVPRFDVRSGGRPGDAPWFWEAVCLFRRDAFDQVGGWPGQFFFGHESIEVAWQLIDRGWTIRYRPDIEIHHPATEPGRHERFHRLNARNRVWVARRNLPAPLVPFYLLSWLVITVVRVHEPRALRQWLAGFVEGWRGDPGRRRPISARTVGRLAALGRPPII